MYKKINLIQHVGTGVPDTETAWKWYRRFFGMDIPMFDAVAEAPLMLRYTNNTVVNKRATMVFNLRGGCAMEIVELKNFKCQPPSNAEHRLGDLGIFVTKVRAGDVAKAMDFFRENRANVISDITLSPDNRKTFYVKDPNGLLFQVFRDDNEFSHTNSVAGGIGGCIIGVSDIEKAKKFYCGLLGFGQVIYDKTGFFDDWACLPGGGNKFRRILLSQSSGPAGAFSEVVGPAFIELVQAFERTPVKMMDGRIWGDLGFIHLGFDVKGMAQIERECAANGFPFTCDSKNALKMGDNTEVHCTYIEDPDGTLIELIEVYKIPILKKLGLFLNVEKRDPSKPLPAWILKCLKFGRRKD